MCGIIGIAGRTPAAPRMMEALKRLEYRGYDSAGIAAFAPGLDRRRAVGKLSALDAVLKEAPMAGTTGIGHTRWATHGRPTTDNAHPHMAPMDAPRVAVVHNGIIENFRPLKDDLIAHGARFAGETDTEVIAALIAGELGAGQDPAAAFTAAVDQLDGAFALAVLIDGADDTLFAARRGSPLVIGIADGEHFVGSDALALAGFAERLVYLEEGDSAILTPDGYTVFAADGSPVTRPESPAMDGGGLVGKGNHRHFMHKEIFEQPIVIAQTLGRYVDPGAGTVTLPDLPLPAGDLRRIIMVACGTAHYAAMVGKYWLESLARLPVEVDIASEFRYRDPVLGDGDLVVVISQSGETADTLAALRHAKGAGIPVAAIVNVPTSTIAREANVRLDTHAGPEIGVASTKAFTCQLAVLACLAVGLAAARGTLTAAEETDAVHRLEHLPAMMARMLVDEDAIAALARDISGARDAFFVGRGTLYPLALEGALKLKEISYIHAEGYAGGELKHGPIALIDAGVPIIGLAPDGDLFGKSWSNLEEIMARQGHVYLFTDADAPTDTLSGHVPMPATDPLTAPIVYALPMQLLAYHTAVEKGTDVDQPRNLAKSVTVE